MYRVEYKTESPSDTEFIGLYASKSEAEIAKKKYIDYHGGSKLENCVVINPDLNNMMNTFKSKLNKF